MSEDKLDIDKMNDGNQAAIAKERFESEQLTELCEAATKEKECVTFDITNVSCETVYDATTSETNMETLIDATTETSIDATMETSKNLQKDNDIPSLSNANDIVTLTKDSNHTERKKKIDFYKLIRILCFLGFIVFTLLFLNEVFLQPYQTNKAIQKSKNLYHQSEQDKATSIVTTTDTSTSSGLQEQASDNSSETTDLAIPNPTRDDKGRLLQFKELLDINEEVKGWLTIPDTDINYVVMQSSKDDPEYYLTRNMFQKEDKAGSLFLDYKSSVEETTQNLVIHGHNMTSTDNMFHRLLEFKTLDYYKARPVFTFDSIYQSGQWKIFAILITNGSSKKEPLFNYTRSTFKNSTDFLNFVYQIRIRSIYNIDTVDVNQKDELITLSTCSYEVKNYRTVIIARKVREGEAPTVDVESVSINPEPLYPYSWYYRYGGKAPELSPNFVEALVNDEIHWYTPVKKELDIPIENK